MTPRSPGIWQPRMSSLRAQCRNTTAGRSRLYDGKGQIAKGRTPSVSALRKSLFCLPIVGNIAWEEGHNIDGLSVLIHSVMDVRPGGIASAAAPTDDIALGNRLP